MKHKPLTISNKFPAGMVQATISIMGNLLSTAISAIAIILITRILGPEKYGVFSVGFSIVLILTKINDAGFNTAIVKFASDKVDIKTKNDIYSITLFYKIIISTVFILIGFLFSRQISNLLNLENDNLILISLTLGLATVYYEHLLSILKSAHLFLNSVIINAVQASTKLIGIGFLSLLSVNSVIPIYSMYILAPIIPVLIYKFFVPKWFEFKIGIKNEKLNKKIISLAAHSSVALISAGIIENIDILFLQKNLSTYETGLYGGVSRIAMVIAMIAYSLGSVLDSRVARYKSRKNLSIYIKKALVVIGIAALGFLLFVPLSRPLMLLTIGKEYIQGLNVLLILAGASFIAIASIPFVSLFYSFNASWYFSVSGLIQLSIVLIGNFVFVPIYGLPAAAWTKLAARMSLFLFTVIAGLIVYQRKYGTNSQKP